ncbi:hypothetical protein GOP47_0016492 [Adiantum capillus-veneris]|uniref:GH16 domain-containing protein n=1 Tax=Adiantum capillus-veneris TaxID=13818 RepID=A0A9D4UI66_ADICA|nr:hypothetical protein GOP47_0016492 [Adiantum capillus-veneris]
MTYWTCEDDLLDVLRRGEELRNCDDLLESKSKTCDDLLLPYKKADDLLLYLTNPAVSKVVPRGEWSVASGCKFSSGVFSARIRTPLKGTGVINNFYLSSNDQGSDVIGFDFLGNFPNRVLTSYAVNGNAGGNQQLFVLSYDTSVDFHTYTIKWDNESIVWLADDTVLRILYKSNASLGFPKKAASIFCHTWDASSVGDGSYAGKVNWTFGPFRSYFTDITAYSPLVSGSWKAPMLASAAALSIVPVPMRPLAIDYCFSNVVVAANDFSIMFDQAGCGGRFRSITTYPSGTFTSRVKCAAEDTSGLLSSFYLSSLEGSKVQDEIDFEWLGKDKSSVQTNYYVNGVGNHEVQVPLGFDCSQAYHTYTITCNSEQIQWLVDGRTVRIVTKTKEAMLNNPYPVKPVYVYASVWNASSINNGGWLWHEAICSLMQIPKMLSEAPKFQPIKISN